MDDLYSNDVKVDALRDDRNSHRDFDVLMELHDVDVKVDRAKGSSMVECQIRDLLKIDRLVDGAHTGKTDDFVDTLTSKIMLQMEVQSRANLCKYDTSGVAHLLRTDMFVDGAKVDQDMEAIAPLLEVDRMMDQAHKSKEYTSGVQSAKPLHLMDATIDGRFKSLLETDEQMDGGDRRSRSKLVDPYSSRKTQDEDLISSLFDVADLFRTDVEVGERAAIQSDDGFELERFEKNDIPGMEFSGNAMGHVEEYFVPVKGLSPSRNDYIPSHLSEKKDSNVTSIMDDLYSNDVKVDALRDDRNSHRDFDVLMELHDVDVKVDRAKGSSMVECQIRDLLKIDRLVDGAHTGKTDDFVDTLTSKIMLQMEVQSRANLCKYDTSGVAHLLRTDMFVDGAKVDQDMEAIAPLLEVDRMMDQAHKSKEYTSGVQSAKPLHLMDATIDGRFKSLLETDEQMDGGDRRSRSKLVDPYSSRKTQDEDLISSLFDVADLFRTDVEVDCLNYSDRSARSSSVVAKERDKHVEGEDLIVGIFGSLPAKQPFSDASGLSMHRSGFKSSSQVKSSLTKDEKEPMKKKEPFLGWFGLSNIPSIFKK